MKVLGFGSMNLDYVYSVPHMVAPGETLFSTKRETFAGGKGLNQSIAAAKAGLKVFHAGLCGTGGGLLLKTLEENGVDVSLIKHSDTEPGHTVIQVDANGQNSIILYGGTNRMITSEYIKEAVGNFEKGDVILLQNEVNRLDEIINTAYAKGMKVVLNPSPFDGAIQACDFNKVSLIFVNEIEIAQLCNTSSEKPEELLDWFESKYPEVQIVLTLGPDGAWYSGKGKRVFQPAIKVETVDTTAAGDTFSGYFLEGWSTGKSIEDSLLRAAKAASIAVSRKGAAPSIPTASELEGC